MPTAQQPRWILPVIVVSQFFCTSLWFADNAVMPDIITAFHVSPGYLAHLTSAVQLGFITGTLIFAILAIADRFSPSLVFCVAAFAAALTNLGAVLHGTQASSLLVFRFLTGFFLAGIYPVGMKIAADYFQKSLGRSLGFLVGALVLGTAFPHLLKSFTLHLPWKYVVLSTSVLAVFGGLLVWIFVPDGPFRRPSPKIKLKAFLNGFRNSDLRSAAWGYFGHMWELYALWAFTPALLAAWQQQHPSSNINISFFSFLVIGVGSLGCVSGGLLSQSFGVKRTATAALFLSGCCCLLSSVFLSADSQWILLFFLLFWGFTVTADSPLFSTMVAQNAPAETTGSSLTIVNCIGFSVTIVSIQLLNLLMTENNIRYIFLLLSAGPVLGLIALLKNKKR